MTISAGSTIQASDFVSTSSGASDEGKVAKLDATGKIPSAFIPADIISLNTRENLDGTTTPQAVFVNPVGELQLGDANETGLEKFFGFIEDSITDAEPAYLNSDNGSAGTISYTANAGNNRYLIVSVMDDTSGSEPSACTWDGASMTKHGTAVQSGVRTTVFGLAIGDSGTNETADVVVTGGSGDALILTYENVDQSNPVGNVGTNSGTGTSASASVTPTTGPTRTVVSFCLGNLFDSLGAGLTSREAVDSGAGDFNPEYIVADTRLVKLTAQSATCALDASGNWSAIALSLNGVQNSIDLKYAGIQSGFTGLTEGVVYYLQNTAGSIGTSAGSTSVLVGKAISETQLLVIHDS